MIKLLDILRENKILVPRRSPEERQKNYQIALQKKIQQYIKDGGKGNLNLSDTPIQSLPPGFKVGGSLILSNASIQSLPPGLEVKGALYLTNTSIQSLSPGLKVGGNLYLMYTPIQSLLPDLEVEGNLELEDTPISKKYTKEEIRKMVPGVKGDIYL
jgi:hypothetical protein